MPTQISCQPGRIYHLDGIRGIAIAMIVFFHSFTSFKNGYLGVDIFLVISGYLLFRNYWENYETFDCKTFILKKIQRLFPLAAGISALCCLISLFVFPYDLIWKTAKSALSAVIACSNLYFDYTFSDYFAPVSRLNPLVHTWYLSVIAQIYLIYACIAFMCRKRSKHFKILLLATGAIASLLANYGHLWMNHFDPLTYVPSTYYWTSGRLWMVFTGAFAHLLPQRGSHTSLCGGALALLIIMGFSKMLPLDTCVLEILTTFCTCLVIAYGGSAPSSKLLRQPLIQALGKYSFSLYIIHWPIIVFGLYVLEAHATYIHMYMKLGLLLACTILTILIYHSIEKRKFSLSACAILLTAALGITVPLIATEGLRDELHVNVNNLCAARYADTGECVILNQGPLHDSMPDFRQELHHAGFGQKANWREKIPRLYGIGLNPQQADFILIGDSHAEALYPGLDILSKKRGWNGAYLHAYVIPFVDIYSEDKPPQRWDAEIADQLYEYLKDNKQIKTVFIANFWQARFRNNVIDWSGKKTYLQKCHEHYIACLRTFLTRIRQTGKQVVVFSDVPRMPIHAVQEYVLRQSFFQQQIDESKITCTTESYNAANGVLNEALSKWENEGLCTVLHPETVLLQSGSFCCYQQGVLYYIDGHHLSLKGSIICIQSLDCKLQWLLGQSKARHQREQQ